MTPISNYELVRRDLLQREQEDLKRLGAAQVSYAGRPAILDAYDDALNLCCHLRQLIEETGNEPPEYAR